MMLSFALTLAQWLIKYLINKNWGIGKQLQEARDRVVEHDRVLQEMLDDEKSIIQEIEDTKEERSRLNKKLAELYFEITEGKRKHEEALKEQADRIGSLSDNDVLRHEL